MFCCYMFIELGFKLTEIQKCTNKATNISQNTGSHQLLELDQPLVGDLADRQYRYAFGQEWNALIE